MKSLWTLFSEVLAALPSGARRYLIRYSISLGLLSILDGLALGLLAIVVAPLISGKPLTLPVIGTVGGTGQLLMLGLVCVLIIAKSAIAVTLLLRATRHFADYELAIGARLFETYVSSPWVERLSRNSADIVRLTESSVATTMGAFLLPASTLLGEALSFVTVIVVLAITQPVTALITLVYLGAIGAILALYITRRAREAGRVSLRYATKTARLVTEMIGALKEVTLRNKGDEIAAVVRDNRWHSTRARSNMQFLNQVPRYALDAGLIGGFVLVGFAGYVVGNGLPAALSSVALFGLAGFRMAPSVVRFQSVLSTVTANAPIARAVLEEIRRSEKASEHLADRPQLPLPEEPAALRFDDVSFRYSPESADAVRDVSITIPFGSTVAFVGSSGAGKSTMIDLILGLLEPTGGRISVDDVPLQEVTAAWRDNVGYVPQEVALFDATVAQNVALSWTGDLDRDRVVDALRQAQLLTTIEKRDGGIDGDIGERGIALSGGQRQRLGIARALYSDPMILVMDEATSALDTSTEAAVTEAIRTLGDSMTIVLVAHRLSTVMHADQIFFMSGGRIEAQGTFEHLVKTVPEFAQQAGLAGLLDG